MNPWGQYIQKTHAHSYSSGNLSCEIETDLWARGILIRSKELSEKVQSLDSKAIKLALGIKLHSSTLGSCRQTGILPLDEIRKLAAVKYVIKGSSVAYHTNTEVKLRSDKYFSKRANKNYSLVHC